MAFAPVPGKVIIPASEQGFCVPGSRVPDGLQPPDNARFTEHECAILLSDKAAHGRMMCRFR